MQSYLFKQTLDFQIEPCSNMMKINRLNTKTYKWKSYTLNEREDSLHGEQSSNLSILSNMSSPFYVVTTTHLSNWS